ncbi:hypothetical protein TIFTF001_038403 [Ficus carica]|uniref:Uncharacterized protein n=1 Tax=Ficus carica TaxID=3494 RepID=A0AA88JD12_FICCA|nr:hypothetical protein TIFTF001_038403 [Ficus carica]
MKNLTDLGENVRHRLESEEKEGKLASTKAEEWLKGVEELEKRVHFVWESHLVAKNKESLDVFLIVKRGVNLAEKWENCLKK